MTITNGYATLAQFKQRYGLTTTDAARDADIELIVQAVSRLIEKRTGRTFFAGTAGTARYYTATSSARVYIDDYATITAVATDDDGDGTIETTWAATDYIKLPTNSTYGEPYSWLEVTPLGAYRFPCGLRNGVKITGTNGWAAIPDEIREACLMQSYRLWQRRAAPFGVMGANEFGVSTVITKLDPDIEQLLAPFMRVEV